MPTFTQLEALQVKGTAAYLRGMQAVVNPIGDMISTRIQMETEVMVSPVGRSIGPWRKWTGARIVENPLPTSHFLQAEPYEKTVGVRRIKVDTDQTGAEMLKFEELGRLAARLRDQLVVAKLIAGTSALCYDGVSFFNTTHPADGDAVAYSNMSGSGTAPWYVLDLSSTELKPLVYGELAAPELTHLWDPKDPNVFNYDEYQSGLRAYATADYGMPQAAYRCAGALDSSNFETAMLAISQRTDNKGLNLGLGNDIMVIVPPILRNDAKRLFGRQDLGSSGENINYGIRWAVCQRLPNS